MLTEKRGLEMSAYLQKKKKNFLKNSWDDATSLSHLDLVILCRASLQILCSSVRLDGERWCTAIHRSLQRYPMGVRLGLQLGQREQPHQCSLKPFMLIF